MIARLTRHLRQRAADDSGVAMLMALFIIAMLATISLGVAGITVSQALPTKIDNKAAKVVQVAQAGIDSALAQIRAANDGSGNGVTTAGTGVNSKLPCVITGNVNSTSTLTYSVKIRYFGHAFDPTSHLNDDVWLQNPANNLGTTCLTTSPYIGIPASSGNAALVPWFATIESAGTGPTVGSSALYGNRSLRTIYKFQISNINIAGGPVLVFPTASNLCMDAANYTTDSTGNTVKSGDKVLLKPCNSALPGQAFSYTANLTLQVAATSPVGQLLCIDDGNATANAATTNLTVGVCDTGLPSNSPAPGNGNDWSQQWSFDGNEQFVGSVTDTSNTSGVCLVSADATPINGSQVVVASCPGTSYRNASSWYPNSKVGAGAAGAALNQLVNYQYFGNCLDVPDGSVSKLFLIGYVCKQNPKPSNVLTTDWNQVFTFDPAAHPDAYVTTNGSNSYCLQTKSATPTLHDVVYVSACNGGTNQQWYYTSNLTGSYSSNYEIQPLSDPGLCLTLTMPAPSSFVTAYAAVEDPNGSGGYNLQQWGYNSVENCSGADNQKWNAPAGLSSSALAGTYEPPNS